VQNSANKVVIDPITAINVGLSMPETFNPVNGEKIIAAINPVNARQITACHVVDVSLCMKTRITYMRLTNMDRSCAATILSKVEQACNARVKSPLQNNQAFF
jgi:hypothetical protein